MNTSGIHPTLDRVLIKPDEVERVTSGGIIIPETENDRYAMAQSIGTIVAIGPDAWSDYKGGRDIRIGDRVCFAKYGGIQMPGKDGHQYRLMNDVDVSAKVDAEVDFTDWKPRTAFSKTGS